MKTTFMNTENSKASEPHKFALNSPQILNLASSNKHLQNLSIYHTRKNIKQQYKSKKLKIIALTWNDEFKLPDGSSSESDIQGYIKYIIKKHKTLPTNPPIHIHINRINNRKDEHKLAKIANI